MHSIDEILFGTAQNFNDELLYVVDQLKSASIEISAESSEITDKKGNVVRTIYTSKSGSFNSTNAFLHPALLNAASGSEITKATASAKIQMPKIAILAAGATLDISDYIAGTLHVIGIYGNGANSVELTLDTQAVFTDETNITYAVSSSKNLTVPSTTTGAPTQYLVKYERSVESGLKMVNVADKFPDTVHLTLYCSYVDPCSDTLKPCYVYIPSFMADPSTTISLDRDNQEMDYNGILQMDYCGADKMLYAIYYPDEEIVTVGTVA